MGNIIEKPFNREQQIERAVFLGHPNLMTTEDLNRQIQILEAQAEDASFGHQIRCSNLFVKHTVTTDPDTGAITKLYFRTPWLTELANVSVMAFGAKFTNFQGSAASAINVYRPENGWSEPIRVHLIMVGTKTLIDNAHGADADYTITGAKFSDDTIKPAAEHYVWTDVIFKLLTDPEFDENGKIVGVPDGKELIAYLGYKKVWVSPHPQRSAYTGELLEMDVYKDYFNFASFQSTEEDVILHPVKKVSSRNQGENMQMFAPGLVLGTPGQEPTLSFADQDSVIRMMFRRLYTLERRVLGDGCETDIDSPSATSRGFNRRSFERSYQPEDIHGNMVLHYKFVVVGGMCFVKGYVGVESWSERRDYTLKVNIGSFRSTANNAGGPLPPSVKFDGITQNPWGFLNSFANGNLHVGVSGEQLWITIGKDFVPSGDFDYTGDFEFSYPIATPWNELLKIALGEDKNDYGQISDFCSDEPLQ